MTVYLTRDAILQANDLPVEEVDVPEWGGVVRVQALSEAAREALERRLFAENRREHIRAELVALSAVDEAGAALFTTEDVDLLEQKNFQAVERVYLVAKRLSAIGKPKEQVEEARKN